MFSRLFRKIRRLVGQAPLPVQAQVQAGEVLMDTYCDVSKSQHEAFVAALDAPAGPNVKLRKLMQSEDPWEA